MPTITIQTDAPDGRSARITLSERILAEHLRDHHYARQLIERLIWAATDAELEGSVPRAASSDGCEIEIDCGDERAAEAVYIQSCTKSVDFMAKATS